MFLKPDNTIFYLFLVLLKTLNFCHQSFGKSSEYGLVEITSKNYESEIINGGRDAWILAVKNVKKITLQQWEEFEFSLRGMKVRVGIIDPKKDGGFLKRKGFLENNAGYPLARVFPYGGWKIKTAGMKDAKSMKDAKKMALQSLPDDNTTKIKTMTELEHFVHSSYGTSPPRFPVLLFTNKRQTAALYKALALKYSAYFNFGVIRKPSVEFQQFHLQDLPLILVMISNILPGKQLTFSSVPYNEKSYGVVSYLTVAKFLYSVHEKHWKELPNIKKFKGKMNFKEDFIKDSKAILDLGTNEDNSPEEMEAVVKEITQENYKGLCTENDLGLCLIAFVDGKDKTMTEKSISMLKDLQGTEDIKEKPLQYLWVNATCHPEYGDVFGIFPDTLPTLLITKPRQRLFLTTTLQDTSLRDINDLVLKILQGLKNLQRYARFNDMLHVDCRYVKVDGKTEEKYNQNEEL